MSSRILLYDSGCSLCAGIASEVASKDLTNGGQLRLLSLRSPEAPRLLDQIHPDGWPWEPTLLEVGDEGEAVRSWTGVRLIAPLIRTVGPRRAQAIARLVSERTASTTPTNPSRRSALMKIGSAVAAVPLLSLGLATETAAGQQFRAPDLTRNEADKAFEVLRRSSEYREVTAAARASGYRPRPAGLLRLGMTTPFGPTVMV